MIYTYHTDTNSCVIIPDEIITENVSEGYSEMTQAEYMKFFVEPVPEGYQRVADENGKPCFVEGMTKQEIYEEQLKQVESTRRALYTNVDALRNEATMIRLTEGDEAKALDYEQQAKDLYLKIRDENPWPIPSSE